MSSLTILFDAFYKSDSIGKLIFYLLFLLSITTWTILVQKWINYVKTKKASDAIFSQIEQNQNQLLQLPTPESDEPYAKLFGTLKKKALEILDKNRYFATDPEQVFLSPHDIELIESQIEVASHMQLKKLDRHLYILHTIVSLAPFVGILGTVWGILLSLFEMKTQTGMLTNTTIIGGLSTALGTTVLGLTIAIPALIAYNFLKNAHKSYFSNMQDFAHFLLSTLQMQYQKADVK